MQLYTYNNKIEKKQQHTVRIHMQKLKKVHDKEYFVLSNNLISNQNLWTLYQAKNNDLIG